MSSYTTVVYVLINLNTTVPALEAFQKAFSNAVVFRLMRTYTTGLLVCCSIQIDEDIYDSTSAGSIREGFSDSQRLQPATHALLRQYLYFGTAASVFVLLLSAASVLVLLY